jgi:hypothetical protein
MSVSAEAEAAAYVTLTLTRALLLAGHSFDVFFPNSGLHLQNTNHGSNFKKYGRGTEQL